MRRRGGPRRRRVGRRHGGPRRRRLGSRHPHDGPRHRLIGGGWPVMAKLLFFCCRAAAAVPGHFASTRSGGRPCSVDVVFTTNSCQHAVAGAVYDDIVGAYRGFMPSRTRAFLVIHHGPLEPHVRCPYCGARVWSMTAAGLARLSSSSSSDGERSADSDSNHSDDESFAAADVSLPLPLASRVSGRRLRGRPAM
ncbi:EID1-like F-box protein 3 [Oryza sativa Japonica Group]|uniref:EID1-like F-box protein 3 n=1 Tax=Oryza sativa subsp. japonica TaxID=39947 RepID=UPI00339C1341